MLVIGNGESRQHIDISKIKKTKIGCNAIYRDFEVDHLVCVDKKMLNEACLTCTNTLIYTRKDWINRYTHIPNIQLVPDIPFEGVGRMDDGWHWGSGPYAVLLAATLSVQSIHLVGFDLYSKDNKINNIYKETLNYKSSDHRAVDPSYWIYQIGRVIEHFPLTQFTFFQTDNWQLPNSWKKSNVAVDKISNIV